MGFGSFSSFSKTSLNSLVNREDSSDDEKPREGGERKSSFMSGFSDALESAKDNLDEMKKDAKSSIHKLKKKATDKMDAMNKSSSDRMDALDDDAADPKPKKDAAEESTSSFLSGIPALPAMPPMPVMPAMPPMPAVDSISDAFPLVANAKAEVTPADKADETDKPESGSLTDNMASMSSFAMGFTSPAKDEASKDVDAKPSAGGFLAGMSAGIPAMPEGIPSFSEGPLGKGSGMGDLMSGMPDMGSISMPAMPAMDSIKMPTMPGGLDGDGKSSFLSAIPDASKITELKNKVPNVVPSELAENSFASGLGKLRASVDLPDHPLMDQIADAAEDAALKAIEKPLNEMRELEDDARSMVDDVEETIEALHTAKGYVETAIPYAKKSFQYATLIVSCWGMVLSLIAFFKGEYIVATTQAISSLVGAFIMRKRKQATEEALRVARETIQEPLEKLEGGTDEMMEDAEEMMRDKMEDTRDQMQAKMRGGFKNGFKSLKPGKIGKDVDFENPIPEVIRSVGRQIIDSVSAFILSFMAPVFLGLPATIVTVMKLVGFWEEMAAYIAVLVALAPVALFMYFFYGKIRDFFLRRAERKALSHLKLDFLLDIDEETPLLGTLNMV